MIHFIKIGDYILINIDEIAYTDTSIDEDCEYILNIVMKDGKRIIIEDDTFRDKVWKQIVEWTGIEEDE
ncbi:MAG: hypothetical protein NC191_09975, partial [Muribaculaceae bacterium]|nr:hypothetical protein [Muribaculaceae bacterium]